MFISKKKLNKLEERIERLENEKIRTYHHGEVSAQKMFTILEADVYRLTEAEKERQKKREKKGIIRFNPQDKPQMSMYERGRMSAAMKNLKVLADARDRLVRELPKDRRIGLSRENADMLENAFRIAMQECADRMGGRNNAIEKRDDV